MTRKTIGFIAAIVTVQVIAVLAFVLPAHDPRPHDVPVGVVGPPAAARAIEAARPGAFDVRRFASAAAAEEAIRDRDVYGAIIPGERRVLVASAASPVVAQALRDGPGAGATVRDVVALDPDDPRGTTLNALFLPLILASLPGALLLSRVASGRGALLGALGIMAAVGGLAVVAVVGPGLGLLPGPYLALAAVAALIVLAMALPAAGLVRLVGPPGLAIAAVAFLLVGNPGSGNASAPELLPGFWRAVGPLLPPGAGGTALRNVAYFDGAALAAPLTVLLAFAGVGALLLLAGRPAERAAGAGSRAPEPRDRLRPHATPSMSA